MTACGSLWLIVWLTKGYQIVLTKPYSVDVESLADPLTPRQC